ncbi:SCO family protein [Methylobacterium nonmethylotrophicum]|uniref:Thioredoxin domain-containing protein n=1 Tax=Methylobacterium nonmethylotrophicum TaxID=1141884 RepID=A0A4Z0NV81_9HYPH|nr:SCO family protein [Methylobacterium nonmethylotrophicum]TGE00816.1 hypothetical protein EU555_08745 [Methylobacterium nonmethylotrophicum]
MPRSIDDVIGQIRTIPRSRAGDRRLASMLHQNAPLFRGLSAGDADRVRGHVLASLESRLLDEDAVHAVKEELRTSFSPVVLAGAARAVRDLVRVDAEIRDLLAAASARIAARDEFVRLDASECCPDRAPRTARDEIASALALQAILENPPGRCCGAASREEPDRGRRAFSLCRNRLGGIVVEDQSERQGTLLDLVQGRTSLVAFFYTRCMNPAKCSLTISRLAGLARLASERATTAEIGVFAISYDPDFDTASRLRAFGQDRGFPFGETARLLRCTTGWEKVRRAFDLQVGYSAATVNAHARELFMLSDRLQAVEVACERLADVERLLADVTETAKGA